MDFGYMAPIGSSAKELFGRPSYLAEMERSIKVAAQGLIPS